MKNREKQLKSINLWKELRCMKSGCDHKPERAVSNLKGGFFVGCITHASQVQGSVIYGEICPFCRGSGFLPHLKHIDKGVCYRCNGSGVFKKLTKGE